jgi:hypothetical protein
VAGSASNAEHETWCAEHETCAFKYRYILYMVSNSVTIQTSVSHSDGRATAGLAGSSFDNLA